jgi:hypothetical protein
MGTAMALDASVSLMFVTKGRFTLGVKAVTSWGQPNRYLSFGESSEMLHEYLVQSNPPPNSKLGPVFTVFIVCGDQSHQHNPESVQASERSKMIYNVYCLL